MLQGCPRKKMPQMYFVALYRLYTVKRAHISCDQQMTDRFNRLIPISFTYLSKIWICFIDRSAIQFDQNYAEKTMASLLMCFR